MKKIKIITIALAIVLVTMLAFVGIYTQTQNRMENQMKDYAFAMDIKGGRNIRLKVNTENETVIKDAEGNVVEEEEELTDEQIAEKGYVKEEIPNNAEEVKTLENYKKAQQVIEKRLKKLEVSNYSIKLEEATGDILIELEENDATDQIISNISTTGKFEIVDSQTNEVLMNNSDIKTAKVMYGAGTSDTNNGTAVYLEIDFTKEGAKKLEEIGNQYVKVENTETEQSEEEQATTEEKKVSLKIDNDEIMSTSFEEPIRTGKLQLSIGKSATDQETIQDYVQQASSMATVLATGNIPVKYDLGENQYILSDITDTTLAVIIYVALALVVIGAIVLVIKYKKLGALGVISYVGFISLLMIIVRYANVVISLEGILGMILAFLLDYILVNKLLANANDRKVAYKDFWVKMIPIMIMIVTFSFIRWTPISSFGMTMFWGFVLMAIYNVMITNSLLKIGKEEK